MSCFQKAYQYDSIKTIKTNILGTLNVLGLVKKIIVECY